MTKKKIVRFARFALASAFLLLNVDVLAHPDATSHCDEPQAITQAVRTITKSDSNLTTETVQLPDTLPLWARSPLVKVRYLIDVSICPAPNEPNALYSYRIGAPYSVVGTNGAIAATLPQAGLRDHIIRAFGSTTQNGRVPATFNLPADVNSIEIVLNTLPYMPAGLTPLSIGSERAMTARQVEDYSLLAYESDLIAGVSAFFGLIALMLCLKRGSDRGMRWFALGSTIWGLRNLLYINPLLPNSGFIAEMLLSYGIVMSGGALIAASLYACHSTTPAILRFIRLSMLAISGAVLVSLFIPVIAPYARAFGFFTVMFMLIWATWQIAKSAKKSIRGVSRPIQYTMVAGIALQLIFGLHDFGIVLGFRPPTSLALVFWGYSCWVLALAALSSAQVVDALNRAQNANIELEERVAQKNAELKIFYDSEQAEKIRAERTRLNREIHDGIGAQLITALRGVERGALSQDQITETLQEGLDELRLLMDTADVGSDLHGALFAWRNRWDPRLSAVGLALLWEVGEEIAEVKLGQPIILQIIRILQESIANVVKHAKATKIEVKVHSAAHELLMYVLDDGVGLGTQQITSANRGLKNMQQRAEQIGASCTVQNREPPTQGTEVLLRLPLGQPAQKT